MAGVSSYYGSTSFTAGNIGGNASTIDTNGYTYGASGDTSLGLEYYIASSQISGGTAAITRAAPNFTSGILQVAAFKAASGGGGATYLPSLISWCQMLINGQIVIW